MLRRLVLPVAVVASLAACQWPPPPQGETIYEIEPNGHPGEALDFPLAPDRFAGEVGGGDFLDRWAYPIPSGYSFTFSCDGNIRLESPTLSDVCDGTPVTSVAPELRIVVFPGDNRGDNVDGPFPYTITATRTPLAP